MDAASIRQLEPELDNYLKRFSHCFCDETEYLCAAYIRGQLSELERKNVERIALRAGIAPRTLQEFLASYNWDQRELAKTLQRMVAQEHADANSVGIIDETSFVKKGTKTPGVQKQYCGAVGKQENCVVTVHLSYSTPNFHCLIGEELFLPESWSNDRARCRKAKIPDEMVYRPKSEIALEIYQLAIASGIRFTWLTFDESRWRVERVFEDDKRYLGMDHFEGRGYPGLMRHLILSAVALLFLARMRLKLLEAYPEITVSQIQQAASSLVQSWWIEPLDAKSLIDATAYRLEYYQRRNAQARKSHTKTRIKKLLALGIDVNVVPKCQWDSG